jgi:predicted thioesterase
MNTQLEKINLLKDKEFTYSFKVKDESYLWSEDQEVLQFGALSTTALMAEIHKCCYDILKNLLDYNQVTIVSHSCIDHLSSTPYSFKVFIKFKITQVVQNRVYFEGEVFDEINKIATFKVVRNIVSKRILKKNLNLKMESINFSGQLPNNNTR